jgi:hypothetical protein
MASSLSASEMVKPGREYRIVLFLKKYQNREEFVLMGNKTKMRSVPIVEVCVLSSVPPKRKSCALYGLAP